MGSAAFSPSFTRITTTTTHSPYKQEKALSAISAAMNDQEEDERTATTPQTTARSLTLGFIGCGTIASAIVTGLATSRNNQIVSHGYSDTYDGTNNSSNLNISQIIISRRSEKNSLALKEQFASLITISDDNQAIVDAADIIFLALLPKQTKDVLQSLRFKDNSNGIDDDSNMDNNNNNRQRRQLLVSLVSTSKLDELVEYSGLPSDSVYKMICLPAVSRREGICILTPPIASTASSSSSSVTLHHHDNDLDGWLVQLLQQLGDVVQADSEEQMAIMTVPSALMGSFYGILRNNQRWLMQHGIPSDKAGLLIGRFYHGMMQDAADKLFIDNQHQQKGSPPPSSSSAADGLATPALDELIAEQTPGGLNEQGLENLSTLGALKAYDQVQDCILARIQGKSDGSLP